MIIDSADLNEVKRRKKELKMKNKQMVPMYYQLAILLKRGFIKLQRDQVSFIKVAHFMDEFYKMKKKKKKTG